MCNEMSPPHQTGNWKGSSTSFFVNMWSISPYHAKAAMTPWWDLFALQLQKTTNRQKYILKAIETYFRDCFLIIPCLATGVLPIIDFTRYLIDGMFFFNFTMQQLKNLILNLIHFVCNNRGCIVLISSWSVDKEMWIQGRHKCALRTVFNRIQVHKWTCWIQGRHKCALRTVFALIAIIHCMTSYL